MIPLFKVFMSEQAANLAAKTLMSGYIGQGKMVEQFEADLTSYTGCKRILAVNSCTSALQLAIHLVKTPDTEVLTTPLTCFATTAAILNNGLRLRWVDVNPYTGNMSLEDLERCLSPNTRIIVVVHFAGYPVDLDRLDQILTRHERQHGHRPWVIEDCAHAFGVTYKNRFIGAHGNICCFSFQAVKTLTTGDGGAIVLPTEELYERAKLLRWFGLDRTKDRTNQDIQEAGFKYHMNDVAASIGIENLKHLPRLMWIQSSNHNYYFEQLSNLNKLGNISLIGERSGWVHPVRVKRRKDFEAYLAAHGIEAVPAHTRNDTHACVRSFRRPLPGMDVLDQEMTCIPSGWWVTEKDAKFVVDTIKKADNVST